MNVGVNFIPGVERYAVQRLNGLGYVVLDPAGALVTGSQTLIKAVADAQCKALQREADRKAKRIERPCLCCGAVFASAGIGNRLCARCRHASHALAEDARPALPRARGGRS